MLPGSVPGLVLNGPNDHVEILPTVPLMHQRKILQPKQRKMQLQVAGPSTSSCPLPPSAEEFVFPTPKETITLSKGQEFPVADFNRIPYNKQHIYQGERYDFVWQFNTLDLDDNQLPDAMLAYNISRNPYCAGRKFANDMRLPAGKERDGTIAEIAKFIIDNTTGYVLGGEGCCDDYFFYADPNDPEFDASQAFLHGGEVDFENWGESTDEFKAQEAEAQASNAKFAWKGLRPLVSAKGVRSSVSAKTPISQSQGSSGSSIQSEESRDSDGEYDPANPELIPSLADHVSEEATKSDDEYSEMAESIWATEIHMDDLPSENGSELSELSSELLQMATANRDYLDYAEEAPSLAEIMAESSGPPPFGYPGATVHEAQATPLTAADITTSGEGYPCPPTPSNSHPTFVPSASIFEQTLPAPISSSAITGELKLDLNPSMSDNMFGTNLLQWSDIKTPISNVQQDVSQVHTQAPEDTEASQLVEPSLFANTSVQAPLPNAQQDFILSLPQATVDAEPVTCIDPQLLEGSATNTLAPASNTTNMHGITQNYDMSQWSAFIAQHRNNIAPVAPVAEASVFNFNDSMPIMPDSGTPFDFDFNMDVDMNPDRFANLDAEMNTLMESNMDAIMDPNLEFNLDAIVDFNSMDTTSAQPDEIMVFNAPELIPANPYQQGVSLETMLSHLQGNTTAGEADTQMAESAVEDAVMTADEQLEMDVLMTADAVEQEEKNPAAAVPIKTRPVAAAPITAVVPEDDGMDSLASIFDSVSLGPTQAIVASANNATPVIVPSVTTPTATVSVETMIPLSIPAIVTPIIAALVDPAVDTTANIAATPLLFAGLSHSTPQTPTSKPKSIRPKVSSNVLSKHKSPPKIRKLKTPASRKPKTRQPVVEAISTNIAQTKDTVTYSQSASSLNLPPVPITTTPTPQEISTTTPKVKTPSLQPSQQVLATISEESLRESADCATEAQPPTSETMDVKVQGEIVDQHNDAEAQQSANGDADSIANVSSVSSASDQPSPTAQSESFDEELAVAPRTSNIYPPEKIQNYLDGLVWLSQQFAQSDTREFDTETREESLDAIACGFYAVRVVKELTRGTFRTETISDYFKPTTPTEEPSATPKPIAKMADANAKSKPTVELPTEAWAERLKQERVDFEVRENEYIARLDAETAKNTASEALVTKLREQITEQAKAVSIAKETQEFSDNTAKEQVKEFTRQSKTLKTCQDELNDSVMHVQQLEKDNADFATQNEQLTKAKDVAEGALQLLKKENEQLVTSSADSDAKIKLYGRTLRKLDEHVTTGRGIVFESLIAQREVNERSHPPGRHTNRDSNIPVPTNVANELSELFETDESDDSGSDQSRRGSSNTVLPTANIESEEHRPTASGSTEPKTITQDEKLAIQPSPESIIKIQELETALGEKTEMLTQLTKALSSANTRITVLETAADEATQKASVDTATIDDLQVAKKSAAAALMNAQADIKKLNNELEVERKAVLETQAGIEKLSTILKTERQTFDDAKEELAELASENNAKDITISELQLTLDLTDSQIKDLRAELEAKVDEASHGTDSDDEIENLKAQLLDLENAFVNSKKALIDSKKALAESKKKEDLADDEVISVKGALDSMTKKLKDTKIAFANQLHIKDAEFENATAAYDEALSAKQKIIDEYEAEQKDLDRSYKELMTEKETLTRHVKIAQDAKKKDNDRYKTMSEQAAKNTLLLAEKSAEIVSLQDEMEQSNRGHLDMRNALIDSHQLEVVSLTSEIDLSHSKIKDIEEALKRALKVQDESTTLRAAMEALEIASREKDGILQQLRIDRVKEVLDLQTEMADIVRAHGISTLELQSRLAEFESNIAREQSFVDLQTECESKIAIALAEHKQEIDLLKQQNVNHINQIIKDADEKVAHKLRIIKEEDSTAMAGTRRLAYMEVEELLSKIKGLEGQINLLTEAPVAPDITQEEVLADLEEQKSLCKSVTESFFKQNAILRKKEDELAELVKANTEVNKQLELKDSTLRGCHDLLNDQRAATTRTKKELDALKKKRMTRVGYQIHKLTGYTLPTDVSMTFLVFAFFTMIAITYFAYYKLITARDAWLIANEENRAWTQDTIASRRMNGLYGTPPGILKTLFGTDFTEIRYALIKRFDFDRTYPG